MVRVLILIVLGIVVVLGIIFIVPFVTYGIASALKLIETPKPEKAKRFLLNIIITKIGTATIFVGLFYVINLNLPDFWFIYGLIWCIGAAIGEIGDTYKPNYTWKEAILGILSEAIYFPVSAGFLALIL